MNKPADRGRRTFLSGATGAMGAGWLATQWPLFLAAAETANERQASGQGFASLDAPLAAGLDAVAAQIIPSGDTPGAREAGAVWFIDALVASSWAWALPKFSEGIQDLDRRSGAELAFADLPFEEQTAVLAEVENGQFFSMMRMLTIAGTFAMPARGGNREKLGWQLVGFNDQHAWQPPFGYYDASSAESPLAAPKNGPQSGGES